MFQFSRWKIGAAVLGVASLTSFAAPAQEPPLAAASVPLFSYGVKYVCGLQKPTGEPGEPAVKPGNYATEINILNPNFVKTAIRKRVLVLVDHGRPVGREPEQVKPRGTDSIDLEAGNATMDDCNHLWQLVYPNLPLPVPMPPLIGYLWIVSREALDVTAVYTAAAPGDPGAPSQGISIDVEQITPKRISAPITGAPIGAVPLL
jgi:hypothetical protein